MPLILVDLKSVAMGVWGWWAFELYTLMASYLGTDAFGGQTIMRSIGLITFMIPLGFNYGCGIFMGNTLGEGKPRVAK